MKFRFLNFIWQKNLFLVNCDENMHKVNALSNNRRQKNDDKREK